MKKSIKNTATKQKKQAARKSKSVKKTVPKKRASKTKKTIVKKKTIGMFPENNVKAKINSKIKEIDKKLDEIRIMVNGYRKIKDPHWGHFGNLARVLSTLTEIC